MLYENCVKITVQQSLPFSYTTGKYADTTCRYQTHQIHVSANVRLKETYVDNSHVSGNRESG